MPKEIHKILVQLRIALCILGENPITMEHFWSFHFTKMPIEDPKFVKLFKEYMIWQFSSFEAF